MGKRSSEQELNSRGTRIYTIPAQNRYGRGEEGGEILLQVLFEVLDRGRPGLPGRSQVRSVAAVLGPQEPVPRPGVGVRDERLPEFLHPPPCGHDRGVRPGVVLAVETENRRTDRARVPQ